MNLKQFSGDLIFKIVLNLGIGHNKAKL